MTDPLQIARLLAGALAAGLILGTERGWAQRTAGEGARAAGMRTFALAALLGGVAALLPGAVAPVLLGVGAATVAAFIGVAYWGSHRLRRDVGMTTVVALLLALALGALAGSGQPLAAIGVAVIAAFILYLKPQLHGWLTRIEPRELAAGLQLLLVSAVVLPLLPDRGMGPLEALNPFRLWLFVVLMSGLSFLGYVLTKRLGSTRGIALAALAGGLVSSTAVTLTFARAARDAPAARRQLAAGIVIASTIMLGRVGVIAAAIHPPLLRALGPVLGAMLLTSVAAALALLWRGRGAVPASPVFRNPFELLPALQMGAIVAIVMLLSRLLYVLAGDVGLWTVAAISGLADVDAITLSSAELARREAAATSATVAILIAVAANTAVKGSLVGLIERAGTAVAVGGAFLLTLASGGAVLLWVAPRLVPG